MSSGEQHHIRLWEQRQAVYVPGEGPGEPWAMEAFGWACATCKTWGAEEHPKRREHAIERHVHGMSKSVMSGDLVALITRWWEEEADFTAACVAPDPSLCSNHVFEEAVRVDGEIVACTVHGGRLARSLAAFLEKSRREEEARIRAAHREQYPIKLSQVNHPEAFLAQFRQEREGAWSVNEHRQGCGAGKDPSKRCICRLGEREESP